MRTYTHAQGDIQKINFYLPRGLAKANLNPEIVKLQERTIKYEGLDLLVLQIDSALGQYLVIPGTVIGHKKSKGQIKVSYIDPIKSQEDKEQVKEIIRDLGLEGCMHFWEEELEN